MTLHVDVRLTCLINITYLLSYLLTKVSQGNVMGRFEVWWDLKSSPYCKFTAESVGEEF